MRRRYRGFRCVATARRYRSEGGRREASWCSERSSKREGLWSSKVEFRAVRNSIVEALVMLGLLSCEFEMVFYKKISGTCKAVPRLSLYITCT